MKALYLHQRYDFGQAKVAVQAGKGSDPGGESAGSAPGSGREAWARSGE